MYFVKITKSFANEKFIYMHHFTKNSFFATDRFIFKMTNDKSILCISVLVKLLFYDIGQVHRHQFKGEAPLFMH